MSIGYSLNVILLNEKAEQSLLGVKLGKKCIKRKIPVSTVATALGVSRQTVYNWFIGAYEPKGGSIEAIKQLIKDLK
jgi:DNA-binding transcriptional regulator YiaG